MASTLLKLLVEDGLLSRQLAEEVRQHADNAGVAVSTSVLFLTGIDENRLAILLGRALDLPACEPDQLRHLLPAMREVLSMQQALKYRAVPLRLEQRGLVLAMADPSDREAVQALATLIGYPLLPRVAPESRLLQAITRCYGKPLPETECRLLARVRPAAIRFPIEDPEIDEALLEEAEIVEDEAEEHRESGAAPATGLNNNLAAAASREEVADVLVAHLAGQFEHLGLFLLREGELRGWRGAIGPRVVDDFAGVNIPVAGSAALQTVLTGQIPFVGQIAEAKLRRHLARALGPASDQVALLPLVLAGRTVGLLYVAGGKIGGERLAGMQQLLGKVACALEILILRNKLARQ